MKKLVEILKKWWLVLIIGIISLVLGCFVLANPGIGFESARLYVLIDYFATGIIGLAVVIANRKEIPGWGWNLAGFIIAIILGIVMVATPGMSGIFLVTLFTVGFIMKGIQAIATAIALKKAEVKGWGWGLALGIITVLAGFSLVINPLVAALSISILVAFSLISSGIEKIILSIQMSKASSAIKKAQEKVAERR